MRESSGQIGWILISSRRLKGICGANLEAQGPRGEDRDAFWHEAGGRREDGACSGDICRLRVPSGCCTPRLLRGVALFSVINHHGDVAGNGRQTGWQAVLVATRQRGSPLHPPALRRRTEVLGCPSPGRSGGTDHASRRAGPEDSSAHWPGPLLRAGVPAAGEGHELGSRAAWGQILVFLLASLRPWQVT